MIARSFAIKPKHTSKSARRSTRASPAAKHLAQPVIMPTRKLPIQAKLTIGQPNDKYEQEADRVADQVMRMSDVDVAQRVETGTVQPMQIQRMCPECEEEMAQRQPIEEEEEELQAKEMPGQTATVTPNLESRISSLKCGGQPLDSATRTFFEPRFGYDFSSVRIHTDERAVETARALGAIAYATGNDIVFSAHSYAPQSAVGRHVLAHELTHVIQQRNGSITDARTDASKPTVVNRLLVQCDSRGSINVSEQIVTTEDISFLEKIVDEGKQSMINRSQGQVTAQALRVQPLTIQRWSVWTCFGDKANIAAAAAALIAAGVAGIALLLAPDPTTVTKWMAAGVVVGIISGIAWLISAIIGLIDCYQAQEDAAQHQREIESLRRQVRQLRRTMRQLQSGRGK